MEKNIVDSSEHLKTKSGLEFSYGNKSDSATSFVGTPHSLLNKKNFDFGDSHSNFPSLTKKSTSYVHPSILKKRNSLVMKQTDSKVSADDRVKKHMQHIKKNLAASSNSSNKKLNVHFSAFRSQNESNAEKSSVAFSRRMQTRIDHLEII